MNGGHIPELFKRVEDIEEELKSLQRGEASPAAPGALENQVQQLLENHPLTGVVASLEDQIRLLREQGSSPEGLENLEAQIRELQENHPLAKKIAGLDDRMMACIKNLETSIIEVEEANRRQASVGGTVDALETRVQALGDSLEGARGESSQISARLDGFSRQLQAIDDRLRHLEEKNPLLPLVAQLQDHLEDMEERLYRQGRALRRHRWMVRAAAVFLIILAIVTAAVLGWLQP